MAAGQPLTRAAQRSDYYELLGVRQDCTEGEIRTAFRQLALKYHPDHNPDNRRAQEVFKIINEAYQTLRDPVRRQLYDWRRSQQNVAINWAGIFR
ncbi:MAG: J domain-containing protein [Chloroflexi bacterium]|nr:J domain-containing protein [Chloroflexota bacterium]